MKTMPLNPDSMIPSLMIHVEKAVRPIRAEESVKCRMREDLYAHLVQIYEDELHRQGDESQAVASACRRLGEPAQLTRELSGALTRAERFQGFISGRIRRRRHEPLWRHAFRMAVQMVVWFVLLSATTIPVVTFLAGFVRESPHPLDETAVSILIRLLIGLGIWFGFIVGAMVMLSTLMCRQFEGTTRFRPRSWSRAVSLTVLAFFAVLFAIFCLNYSVSGDLIDALNFIPQWWCLAGLTAAGFPWLCYLAAKEKDRSQPWTALQIDDATA